MELPGVEKNPYWTGMTCVRCGREYDTDYRGFVCEECGVAGILDPEYDLAAVAGEIDAARARTGEPFPAPWRPDLWRFAPLLPLRPVAPHGAWAVGDTPLHAPAPLRDELGMPRLWLKDDTGLPSASLKDRAAAMALADAARLGIDHVSCASTGNAAASLAVLAARAGIHSTIYVPAAAPQAKLLQMELHGARVIRVDGTYDEAFDLSVQEQRARGWYSRNCAYNPLLVEGKKTAILETCLALGWRAPDAVFVPVGDGCIVSSVAKGLAELHAVGLIERLPRVFGVQAAGASPLATAWQQAGGTAAALSPLEIDAAVRPVASPRTVADSISVGVPRNRIKAWRKVAATGGGFLGVEDAEIVAAIRRLAARAGVWAEPSGAAGLAGLVKALETGLVERDDEVVVLVTGHGLKDPRAGAASPPA